MAGTYGQARNYFPTFYQLAKSLSPIDGQIFIDGATAYNNAIMGNTDNVASDAAYPGWDGFVQWCNAVYEEALTEGKSAVQLTTYRVMLGAMGGGLQEDNEAGADATLAANADDDSLIGGVMHDIKQFLAGLETDLKWAVVGVAIVGGIYLYTKVKA